MLLSARSMHIDIPSFSRGRNQALHASMTFLSLLLVNLMAERPVYVVVVFVGIAPATAINRRDTVSRNREAASCKYHSFFETSSIVLAEAGYCCTSGCKNIIFQSYSGAVDDSFRRTHTAVLGLAWRRRNNL